MGYISFLHEATPQQVLPTKPQQLFRFNSRSRLKILLSFLSSLYPPVQNSSLRRQPVIAPQNPHGSLPSRLMTSRSFARSARHIVAKIKSQATPQARFLSTIATTQASSNQNGVEARGPIRFSSRLEEGRALTQDVWSIYKSVLATCSPLRITLLSLTVYFDVAPQIFPQIASISVKGTWTLPRHLGSGKRPRRLCNRCLPTIILTQRADFVSVRPSRNTTKRTLVGPSTLKRRSSSPAVPTKVSCTHGNGLTKSNRSTVFRSILCFHCVPRVWG